MAARQGYASHTPTCARIDSGFAAGRFTRQTYDRKMIQNMIQKRMFLVFVALALLPCASHAANTRVFPDSLVEQQAAQPPAASTPGTVRPAISAVPSAGRPAVREIEEQKRVTAYTLPPDLYRKAKALGRIRFVTNLVGFAYSLCVLALILQLHLAPNFRDWAERISRNRFVQSFLFTSSLVVAVSVLESPMSIYEHVVSRKYGLSVEGWGALAWDWTKELLLFMVIGTVMVWILYAMIRRRPRAWWFYSWLISVPLFVFLSFVEPFILEPMFFTFAPLDQKAPALVAQIERVVARAGLDIPPARIFWMKASDKTPTMNLYVSGLGASKRIVVWDNTVDKETTPEIVSGVGHEMGHYALGHVWKGLAFTLTLMLVLLYLGYRSVGWVLRRWGPEWGIRGLDDWASLPVLLFLLSIFSFLSDPLANAYSRSVEHQADVYGIEVTHGILPDAAQAAADSFQVEGEAMLAEPDPSRLNVFLFYTHPPVSDRVRFLLHYDPWSRGKPEFVK